MSHATVNDSQGLLFYTAEDFLERVLRLDRQELETCNGELDTLSCDVLDMCEKEMRACESQIQLYQRALRHLRSNTNWIADSKKKLIMTLRYLITKENEWIDILFNVALEGLTDLTYNDAHAAFCKNFQNRCWAFDQLYSCFGVDVVARMFADPKKISKAKSKPLR